MACLSNYVLRATTALVLTTGLLGATPAFPGGHNAPGRVIELIEVTDEQLRVLRTNNPAFSQMDDEELTRLVSILKNEEGMVSGKTVSDEIGVLVLAHGFHGDGYDEFRAAFKPVADAHPTGYGFGLAILESDHLQKVVNQITSQGAKKIILFPVTSMLNFITVSVNGKLTEPGLCRSTLVMVALTPCPPAKCLILSKSPMI